MNRADVQGLVFSSYSAWPASRVVLVTFGEGDSSAWLRRLLPGITRANEARRRAAILRNVAFTARGIQRLGLDAATFAQFSPEFRQGMAHPARSELLGDVGEDAPSSWEFGADADPIDAVLFLYAADDSRIGEAEALLLSGLERFGLSARVLPTYLPSDGREHFGFRMGASQPGLTRGERRRGRDRVPLGEFLLGHRNAYGDIAEYPTAPIVRSTRELPLRLGRSRVDFGRNGTYLVLRKLEQRPAAFLRHTRALASDGSDAAAAAARLIGRWPNGAPLVLRPEAPPEGAPWSERPFGYGADPSGSRCPLGAHVRRANPRDELGRGARAHRLLRRGRLYGPPFAGLESVPEDSPERGLVFVALNADLSRQFETVQGSFLNGRGGFGPPGERDPLLGRDASERRSDSGEYAPSVRGLRRLVRLRGGLYAFLPSLSALNYLTEVAAKR